MQNYTKNLTITPKVNEKKKKVFTELVYSRIKYYYDLKTDTELATFLGITSQAISNSVNRNTPNWNNIITKCEDLSVDWLLTGKGEVLRNSSKNDEKCEICTVKDRLIAEQDRHLKTKGELVAQHKEENERLKEDICEIKKYSGIIPAKIAGVSSAG
jgi:hypothetical protein